MEFNKEYDELFVDEAEKAKAFDKLAEMFYDKNFGATSKSEIELLMFSIYMEKMIDKYKGENGVIDYQKCSNYEMAKTLGLTSEKVKNLKIKKQQRYPVDFDWQLSLAGMKDNIRYDKHTEKIVIPIPDPNVYNEVKNFVQQHGGYIEAMIGSDAIKIRLEYLVLMFYAVLGDDDKKKFENEVKKHIKETESKNNVITDSDKIKALKDTLEIAENLTSIVSNVVSCFTSPFAGVVQVAGKLSKVVK